MTKLTSSTSSDFRVFVVENSLHWLHFTTSLTLRQFTRTDPCWPADLCLPFWPFWNQVNLWLVHWWTRLRKWKSWHCDNQSEGDWTYNKNNNKGRKRRPEDRESYESEGICGNWKSKIQPDYPVVALYEEVCWVGTVVFSNNADAKIGLKSGFFR